LFAVSSEGGAVVASPFTGEIIGTFDLPTGTRVAPIVVNGGLYMLLGDASLVALR
jgi:hypothetical protein